MNKRSKAPVVVVVVLLAVIFSPVRRVLAAAPTYGPDVVTSTAISTSEIDLIWTAIPASPAVTGYKIQRESPVGGGFTTIVANTGSSATSYADTGLAAGTVYNYRVAAINGDGTGPFGPSSINVNSASAETLSLPLGPPDPPTKLTATASSTSEIDLSWTASQSGAQILGYRVERELLPGAGFVTVVNNTGSANTTFNDIGLYPPGVTYGYRVSGINVFGAGSPSAVVSATTLAVPASAPLDAKAIAGSGQATVSWSPPVFPGGTITGYAVSSTPSGFGVTVAGNATSAVVTGLTSGFSYSFTVVAINAAGAGLPNYTNPIIPVATPPPSAATTTAPYGSSSVVSAPSPAAPPSSSGFYFSFNLYRGLRSQAVTELQKILIKKGFLSVSPTGYFGALTEAAVRAYQRAHYISPTGTVGPLTRAYLNAGLY